MALQRQPSFGAIVGAEFVLTAIWILAPIVPIRLIGLGVEAAIVLFGGPPHWDGRPSWA